MRSKSRHGLELSLTQHALPFILARSPPMYESATLYFFQTTSKRCIDEDTKEKLARN
jgi:hypothetical protein